MNPLTLLLAVALASVARAGNVTEEVEQPGLPQVSDVLRKASHTVNAFAARAASMQEKVRLKQQAAKAALAQTKAHYETLLLEMDNRTRDLIKGNGDINNQIDMLVTSNGQFKAEAVRLRNSNDLMWKSLDHLLTKVDAATQFTAESLRLSDMAKFPDLAVLGEDVVPASPLENFLKMAEALKHMRPSPAVSSPRRASLLQLHHLARVQEQPDDEHLLHSRRGAETYVPLLMRSLEELAEAEAEGEANLKAQFEAAAAERKKQIDALLAEQQSLRQTRHEHRGKNKDLAKARDHLQTRREQLVQRLQGVKELAISIGKEAISVVNERQQNTTVALPASAPSSTFPASQAPVQTVANTSSLIATEVVKQKPTTATASAFSSKWSKRPASWFS